MGWGKGNREQGGGQEHRWRLSFLPPPAGLRCTASERSRHEGKCETWAWLPSGPRRPCFEILVTWTHLADTDAEAWGGPILSPLCGRLPITSTPLFVKYTQQVPSNPAAPLSQVVVPSLLSSALDSAPSKQVWWMLLPDSEAGRAVLRICAFTRAKKEPQLGSPCCFRVADFFCSPTKDRFRSALLLWGQGPGLAFCCMVLNGAHSCCTVSSRQPGPSPR